MEDEQQKNKQSFGEDFCPLFKRLQNQASPGGSALNDPVPIDFRGYMSTLKAPTARNPFKYFFASYLPDFSRDFVLYE